MHPSVKVPKTDASVYLPESARTLYPPLHLKASISQHGIISPSPLTFGGLGLPRGAGPLWVPSLEPHSRQGLYESRGGPLSKSSQSLGSVQVYASSISDPSVKGRVDHLCLLWIFNLFISSKFIFGRQDLDLCACVCEI